MKVDDPATQRSIADLGMVKAVKIGGGNVGIDLEVAVPSGPTAVELRKRCVEAVRGLKGVDHVSVNLMAPTGKPKGPERNILKTVKNLVAVASGKGGVGKSTTAVNLAVALSETGSKVGLLDADIYGPSIPTMIRIDEPPESLPDKTLVPAVGLGIKIVSMAFFMSGDKAAILRGPMVSGYVSQFLVHVEWGDLDYLIIDYPPGTGDIQLTLSQQAPITGAVITTTPQDISLVDVRRAIAMFESTSVPVLGVCETMSYFICDECNKKHFIFKRGGGERMAKLTGVPFLGSIPIDPRVTEGGDSGEPILKGHPDSEVAAAYRALAELVTAQLAALSAERGNYLESFSLQWTA